MVEVTQEDREAYLAMNMLPEFDAADVRAGLWDKVTGLQAFARHRIAAENAAQQAITALRARIAELEARLEIDQAHPYDGIAARDATIAALEAERAEWVEVERLRMGKV